MKSGFKIISCLCLNMFMCKHIYIYTYICIYIECIWYLSLKQVAIESWPEWDLNSQLLNSFQKL